RSLHCHVDCWMSEDSRLPSRLNHPIPFGKKHILITGPSRGGERPQLRTIALNSRPFMCARQRAEIDPSRADAARPEVSKTFCKKIRDVPVQSVFIEIP